MTSIFKKKKKKGTLGKRINFPVHTVLKKSAFHVNKLLCGGDLEEGGRGGEEEGGEDGEEEGGTGMRRSRRRRGKRRKENPSPKFIWSCQGHCSTRRGKYVGPERSSTGLWIHTQSLTHRRHSCRQTLPLSFQAKGAEMQEPLSL